MANIDVGGGSHGKKPSNADIPLVPFIDLLLCCVMFLLVTAVWNQLAQLSVSQKVPGESGVDEVTQDALQLIVQVTPEGYVVSSTAGDQVKFPKLGAEFDVAALHERLASVHDARPGERAISIATDDGVPYAAVVATMDVARQCGFTAITM